MEQTLVRIELLRSWAPTILEMGEEAELKDLLEIVRLRAGVGEEVAALEEDAGAFFFALLKADRACVPFASTLLYLDEAAAEAAAEGSGGFLNPLSWYGVHRWDLVQVLDHWAGQINDTITSDVIDTHPAEVAAAFHALREDRGREYVNTCFINERGEWRRWIDSEDRDWMARYIEAARTTCGRVP